jgi:hypothetical protein
MFQPVIIKQVEALSTSWEGLSPAGWSSISSALHAETPCMPTCAWHKTQLGMLSAKIKLMQFVLATFESHLT